MAADPLAPFAGHRYLGLETRQSGGGSVATPLWFVAEGRVLYARTFAGTGKVRRLHRDGRVRADPCARAGRPRGDWRGGEARFVDGAEARRANRLLTRRYGLRKRLADLWYARRLGPIVVIAIDLDAPLAVENG